jgi:uncharacterized protein (DUF58 family)
MAKYLQDQILAKAESLGIKARQVVEGLRVGDHKSPFRGFSIEFVQHREYVPGDDIRHIDWKSYARSERYTIKQYEQETNFVAHLIVDGSASMAYGEGSENKLEFAKLLAATLAYVTIRQRDSISLNVVDAAFRSELPPSSQLGHLQTILYTLENLQPQEKTGLGPLLSQIADKSRRRGIVFIISDLFDDVDEFLKGVQHMKYKGHEVTLFHVLHNDEIEFPFTGNIRFEGMEEIDEIKTRPHLIRPTYIKAFQEFLSSLEQGCTSYGCDYVQMPTNRALAETLSDYLVRRLQMSRLASSSYR